MSREDDRHFGTADLARATEPRAMPEHEDRRMEAMQDAQDRKPDLDLDQLPADKEQSEPLAALFQGQAADDFRRRWDAIQIGFVDDPRAAVRNADELVAQVLRSLAESFAEQRSQIEGGLGDGQQGDTEHMRVALQRYRSFFQRLLSL